MRRAAHWHGRQNRACRAIRTSPRLRTARHGRALVIGATSGEKHLGIPGPGNWLGVAIHSYDHEDLESIDDVSKTLLDQLDEVFISYNKQRGKKFKITDTGGPGKAIKFLKAGIKAHEQESKK